MDALSAVLNTSSVAPDYGLLNSQRRKPEDEAQAQQEAQQARQAAEQKQEELAEQTRAARETAQELACPSRSEVPALLEGVVSQISSSSKWKLSDLQEVSKTRLVTPTYV